MGSKVHDGRGFWHRVRGAWRRRKRGLFDSTALAACETLLLVSFISTSPARNPRSLGGSLSTLMCIDSKPRLMMPYGLVRKSDAVAIIQRFILDVSAAGFQGCFRMNNGGAFTSREFVKLYNDAKIRREYTALDTPKQHAVVKNAIWRTMKVVYAARREALRLSPAADLTSIPHLYDSWGRLWLESAIGAADSFDRSSTIVNPERLSPYHVFTGKPQHLELVPSLQSGTIGVNCLSKKDVQWVPCSCLNTENNYSSTTVKALKVSTRVA